MQKKQYNQETTVLFYLTHRQDHYQVLPKAPALLEPHYQIVSCPIQRCSRCILQPQSTWQKHFCSKGDGDQKVINWSQYSNLIIKNILLGLQEPRQSGKVSWT